jgi:hypothetical protein
MLKKIKKIMGKGEYSAYTDEEFEKIKNIFDKSEYSTDEQLQNKALKFFDYPNPKYGNAVKEKEILKIKEYMEKVENFIETVSDQRMKKAYNYWFLFYKEKLRISEERFKENLKKIK